MSSNRCHRCSRKSIGRGIKEDYAGWGNDINDLDEPQKSIRLRMIDEFNKLRR